jgi:hypothetical protein
MADQSNTTSSNPAPIVGRAVVPDWDSQRSELDLAAFLLVVAARQHHALIS